MKQRDKSMRILYLSSRKHLNHFCACISPININQIGIEQEKLNEDAHKKRNK